jgi:hypothetical protein
MLHFTLSSFFSSKPLSLSLCLLLFMRPWRKIRKIADDLIRGGRGLGQSRLLISGTKEVF